MNDKHQEEVASFSIESHYAKQPDGYVYYYWRIVGHDTWNVQKTAMKEVPTVEMVTKIHDRVLGKTPSKPEEI